MAGWGNSFAYHVRVKVHRQPQTTVVPKVSMMVVVVVVVFTGANQNSIIVPYFESRSIR
jgi:hypothetical protein